MSRAERGKGLRTAPLAMRTSMRKTASAGNQSLARPVAGHPHELPWRRAIEQNGPPGDNVRTFASICKGCSRSAPNGRCRGLSGYFRTSPRSRRRTRKEPSSRASFQPGSQAVVSGMCGRSAERWASMTIDRSAGHDRARSRSNEVRSSREMFEKQGGFPGPGVPCICSCAMRASTRW